MKEEKESRHNCNESHYNEVYEFYPGRPTSLSQIRTHTHRLILLYKLDKILRTFYRCRFSHEVYYLVPAVIACSWLWNIYKFRGCEVRALPRNFLYQFNGRHKLGLASGSPHPGGLDHLKSSTVCIYKKKKAQILPGDQFPFINYDQRLL